MKKTNLLEALEEIAKQFSIRVIYDQFFGQGGFCRLKDQPYIILNKTLSYETKINLFLDGLKKFPLHSIQLPPRVKELIEKGKS
ncbi:MAG: hypothetical protein ABIL05_01750 [candidate division WOR-3 bacterium]